MARMKTELENNGIQVTGLCVPGWIPSKESAAKIADYVVSLDLGQRDLVVIDMFSNSAVMGTDCDGMPCKPVKLDDGRYHLLGELQATPRTCFQNILKEMHPVLDAASGARILLLTPLPRYAGGEGCCSDPSHVSNRGTTELTAELIKSSMLVKKVIEADPKAGQVMVFHPSGIFGASGSDPSEWCTAGGNSVWQDSVHLTAEAYLSMGMGILAAGDGDEQIPTKRRRLESVVPGSTSSQPVRRGAVPLPAWVSGQTPRRGRGRGRGGATGQDWLPVYRGRGYGRGRPGNPFRGGFGRFGGRRGGRGRGY
jgi:hypothetical protein